MKSYEELEKENAELKQQINEQQPNTSFNLSINAVVSSSLEAKNMIKDIIEIQKEYSCNCTLNLKCLISNDYKINFTTFNV